MSFKPILAAAFLGCASLAAIATPAAAQDARYGAYSDGYRDWRGPRPITIGTPRGDFRFDSSDRAYYRLTAAPYFFRPGYRYEYTDRCDRQGCTVLVFRGRDPRPIDRIYAPMLPRWVSYAPRDGRSDYGRDDYGWRDDSLRDGAPRAVAPPPPPQPAPPPRYDNRPNGPVDNGPPMRPRYDRDDSGLDGGRR